MGRKKTKPAVKKVEPQPKPIDPAAIRIIEAINTLNRLRGSSLQYRIVGMEENRELGNRVKRLTE